MLRTRAPLMLVLGCTLLAAIVATTATRHSPAQEEIPAQCGVERWAVKTLTDPAAPQVNLTPKPTTVEELVMLPVPDGFGRDVGRLEPEFQVYTVTATLIEFKEEPDGDIHLVIVGESAESMIAEIPDPVCAQGSRVLAQISRARAKFVDRFGQPSRTSWIPADAPIRATGVLFFDVHHGQRGVAPNAVELHPVIDMGP
jgi:hypothetical protein